MKENQRVMLTKRLLKESLLGLLKEKRIEKISISELCKEAGINRSTFYKHYDTQYDLLYELETDLAEDLHKYINKNKNKFKGDFSRRIEVIYDYFACHRETARILFENNTADSEFALMLFKIPGLWEDVNENMEKLYGKEGEELVLTFIINGAYSMVRKWLLEDSDLSPKEVADIASGMHIEGYC